MTLHWPSVAVGMVLVGVGPTVAIVLAALLLSAWEWVRRSFQRRKYVAMYQDLRAEADRRRAQVTDTLKQAALNPPAQPVWRSIERIAIDRLVGAPVAAIDELRDWPMGYDPNQDGA